MDGFYGNEAIRGHSVARKRTTRIYLGTLDDSLIDRAC